MAQVLIGNQTLKDKGFDVKFLIKKKRVIEISAFAVGLRDIAGTGLFSYILLHLKDLVSSIFTLWIGVGELWVPMII